MENEKREYTAKEAVQELLEDVNKSLASGEFNLRMMSDYPYPYNYYGSAFKKWCELNSITGDRLADVKFAEESGIKDMSLTPFELVMLTKGGSIPIEFFYWTNADVIGPHMWIEIFYDQLLIRGDNVSQLIIKDISSKVNEDNVIKVLTALLYRTYNTGINERSLRFDRLIYSKFSKENSRHNLSLKYQIMNNFPEKVLDDLTVKAICFVLLDYKFTTDDYTKEFLKTLQSILNRNTVVLRERIKFYGPGSIRVIVKNSLEFFYRETNEKEFKSFMKNELFNYELFTKLAGFKVKKDLGL